MGTKLHPDLIDGNVTKYSKELPEFETWSGDQPVPRIGERINTNFFSKSDSGIVHCYFTEYGYLGIVVEMDTAPQWFTDRNKNNLALLFGVDLIE